MINTKLRIIQLIQEELMRQGKDSSLHIIGGKWTLESEAMYVYSETHTEKDSLSRLMEMKEDE